MVKLRQRTQPFFSAIGSHDWQRHSVVQSIGTFKNTLPGFFNKCLLLLIADLQAGKALSAAMKKHVHIFRPVTVSVIEAGEQGGILQEMLSELAIIFGQKE